MGRKILLIFVFLSFWENLGAELPVYNCRSFGARGDGQTNDGKIIQEILDQKGPEIIVFLPAGTYLLKQPLLIRNDNISLVGESPQKTFLLFSPDDQKTSSAITISGLIDYRWFPVNFRKENLETELSKNFTSGDILEIACDFSETNFRRQKTFLSPIEKISENRIYLNENLPEEFITGANCRIRRYLPRKNITLKNFTLSTSNENNFRGIEIEIAQKINLENLRISGFKKNAIRLQQVYEIQISSCTFSIDKISGKSAKNSGIYLSQSNKVMIKNNHLENYSPGILLNHFNFNYQFLENTFTGCLCPVYDRQNQKKKLSGDW